MDHQQLRSMIIKLESRLSDDDRERLHFYLGNDVPRKIRDDASLRGTLCLIDSLFDQDKINEHDFTFLIRAFEQIQCIDAVNLLKEHQSEMLSQSIQSLALIMPTTIKKLIEDHDIDKYSVYKHRFESNLVNNNDDDEGNNNIEMISLETSNIDGHSLKSTEKKIVKHPKLKKSKYYLLGILILSISGLLSLTAFIICRTHLSNKLKQLSEKYQKQTELINELTHFRSMDNHTIQQLTNLKINQTELINELTHLRSMDNHIIQQSTNLKLNQTELINELTHLRSMDNHTIQQLTNLVSSYQQLARRSQLKANLKWKPNATTIAGGNQLISPHGIYVDYLKQYIYIADSGNHRILKWKLGENNGQVVAGENGELNYPVDVIVDENNKDLIICDIGNRRVIRWSLENQQNNKIIVDNIKCFGLMINENGDLFVSDEEKNEVKRWRKGEQGEGTIVANQLNHPIFIFVDRQETVYVSDSWNHRVMKWAKDAKEGTVVAGGHGNGGGLNQLSYPYGLIVNEVGDVFVADSGNSRIMCWSPGSDEGRVVVGGNGDGQRSNQFHYLRELSFDFENNLYVIDYENHRIQQFELDKN